MQFFFFAAATIVCMWVVIQQAKVSFWRRRAQDAEKYLAQARDEQRQAINQRTATVEHMSEVVRRCESLSSALDSERKTVAQLRAQVQEMSRR